MKKEILIAIGITILFLGTCITPTIAMDNVKKSSIPISSGNTLYVGGTGPENYTTIREALENVTDSETIYVYNDSSPYYENFLMIDKSIQIIGEDKNTTTIDSVKGLTIFIVYSDFVTITGLNFINSSNCGIHLDGSSNSIIYNNKISGHKGAGIMIDDNSNYNEVYNNEVTSCNTGILVYWYSSQNKIHDNIVNDNGYGISIGGESSNYNLIVKNKGFGNGYSLHIYQNANLNTIEDNYFEAGSHHPWWGIMIQGSSDKNSILGNSFVKYNHAADVRQNSNDNVFSKNNFLKSSSDDATDECNNIWDLGYNEGGNYYSLYMGSDSDENGIGDTPQEILGGSNVDKYPLMNPHGSIMNIETQEIYRTIQYAIDSSLTKSGHTIQLQKHTYLEHIEITKEIKLSGEKPTEAIIDGLKNDIPITIKTDYVQLNFLQIQNCGTQNTDSGIKIVTDNNIIKQTTITNCENGIIISQGNNNHIYHNNFMNNNQHAKDDGKNNWDNGYPSGGNYWDDYTGSDNNGDGIGDIPYEVPGGENIDHYPYIYQNGWNNNAPVSPIISGPSLCGVGKCYNFTFLSVDVDDDDISYLILWGDNTSTGWTEFYRSGKIKIFNHTWQKIGSYQIIAKVKDTLNYHSEWSEPFNINVVENGPPEKPKINGPRFGIVGKTYDFSVQTIDPNNNDVFYWIDWGDNTNTGWIGPFESGQQINVNHTWKEQGIYKIATKAKDSLQEESEWEQLTVRMPRDYNNNATRNIFIKRIWEKFHQHFNIVLLLLKEIGYNYNLLLVMEVFL